MNYPPIPPNCTQFSKDFSGDAIFLVACSTCPNSGYIDSIPIDCAEWRKIIAAVARCEWSDIAREICEKEFIKRNPLDTNWHEVGSLPAYKAALENAEAWRKWSSES